MTEPLDYLEAHQADSLRQLIELCRIPGISRYETHWKDLSRSAELTARFMKEAGLEKAEVIDLPGGPPYVYGEWLKAPGKPTVLLYAHHDVQPVGDQTKWHSPPFEPVVRDGRIYGRGTVDDKSGVIVHLAAISACLKTIGELPLNIKFVVEGDEESGSRTLRLFLEKYKSKLKADVLCLTDCANLETGLPCLTYSLRGLASVKVRLSTVAAPLHSGMWGGVIPDAPLALAKLLGTLMDNEGKVLVKGFYDDVMEPSDWERKQIAKLPWNERQFRKDAGIVGETRFIGDAKWSPYERLWVRPALAVLAIEGSSMQGYSNQIVPCAEAIVSCRLVPNQDPKQVQQRVTEHLVRETPFGAKLEVTPLDTAPAWRTQPEGPYFAAALKALSKGFGREAAIIGAGGSIPFVHYFNEALGKMPTLLLGLEDPQCAAHGDNESMELADFKKGTIAAVHLYRELAAVTPSPSG